MQYKPLDAGPPVWGYGQYATPKRETEPAVLANCVVAVAVPKYYGGTTYVTSVRDTKLQ